MTDTLISFSTAKLAKERGFNEWCNTGFVNRKFIEYREIYLSKIEEFNLLHDVDILTFIPLHEPWYYAPTQSLLQKWLREKHNLYVGIYYRNFDNKWISEVFYIKHPLKNHKNSYSVLNTYEEALEQGLFEALKLINNG